MSRFHRLALLAGALTLSTACAVAPEGEDESTPVDEVTSALSPAPVLTGPVSLRKPDGLVLSTGNLYFTSHDASEATVWRTAQSASPGQEARLWHAKGAIFGDIVFAQVGGVWWGYFFSQKSGNVSIKRVPLTGGTATTLNEEVQNVDVVNSHRNLVTDGVNLYWQDALGVRKMPIGSDDIIELDTTAPNTPTAGIALQTGKVIYASATPSAMCRPGARSRRHSRARSQPRLAV